MASALNMSQPSYSRIENSDQCCAKYLDRIAKALGTTPDVLRTYHLSNPPDQSPADELTAARTLITQLQQEVAEYKSVARHWQQLWHEHCGGGPTP